MTAKRYNLIKKHFKAKRDEDLFDSYYYSSDTNNFKQCEYDASIATKEMLNVNDSVKALERAQKFLSDIDDDYYKGNVEDVSNSIEDGIRELSDVKDAINDLATAYEHAQTWGDDWKEIALSMLTYMLEHHPDEIDDMGVIKHSINKNFLRSIETTSKFNI